MADLTMYQEALKKASATIERLIAENDRLREQEPVAIIGMGCRLPGGADSPDAFWSLLDQGRDAVIPVPPDRWQAERYYDPDPETPGKMYLREGGFLASSPYGFEPRFFGISPREARALDPQQRLLLETAWEALEYAGIDPASLTGSRTGVFIGISSSDYECAHIFSDNPDLIDPYSLTGITFSTAAGRISYTLGLEGPSIPVDTACSSSLVALHMACHALRSGECDLALVGGVNLMLTPEPLISFCKLRALSPEGRSKAFDASANGYGRGEGCGVIVLKRLDAARRDGDPILALVKGSALNNDGRSNGFTTPNGLAQRRVIVAALENAGLGADDIDYLEAHGTGTPLGDPIEAEAIAAALGGSRDRSRPLLVGSVKSNIGHLEAAAGVAGIIKLILAMKHERIPPHLHFTTPNPHIAWDELPLRITAGGAAWPRSSRPRRAGISGFGFSGTNAHVILEEPPLPEQENGDRRSSHLLVLSAADEPALRELAGRYARFLEGPDIPPLAALCATAATGRGQFAHGLAVAGTAPAELARRLAAYSTGKIETGMHFRKGKPEPRSGPVFLFTGQGSQYPGMGRELYDTAPVYRDALDRCDLLFAPLLGCSIRDMMHTGSEEELACTMYTQPAIFSLEYALASLWRSWGGTPSAVLGHSIGEFVAACVSGVLSLEDAVTLVAHRGRLMNALPAGGVMAALLCPESLAAPYLALHSDQVSVAAVNAPGTVVISGEQAGVAAVVAALKQDGIGAQYLTVSHAFHSHLMEPALDEFERIAAGMTFHAPRIPVISNVTALPAAGDDLRSASYWRRHLRGAVRFGASVELLKQQGHDLFLEIGATATLSSFVRQIPGDARCASSLKRGASPWHTLTQALGELFAAGIAIDWRGYDAPYRSPRGHLPTYPFQREILVMDPVRSGVRAAAPLVAAVSGAGRPLLGVLLESPSPEHRFSSFIGVPYDAWLEGHVINETAIVPATAYLEMGLAAAASQSPVGTPLVIGQARFSTPLFRNGEPVEVQTIRRPDTGEVEIFSRSGNGWSLHASMRANIQPEAGLTLFPEPLLRTADEPARVIRDGSDFYADMLGKGYRYSGLFRSIREISCREGASTARVEIPEEAANGYLFHPALLDGCLTLAGATLLYGSEPLPDGVIFVPTAIESLAFSGAPATALSVHCLLRGMSGAAAVFDLTGVDRAGKPVLRIDGLVMRRMRREQLVPTDRSALERLLYRQLWREQTSQGAVHPSPGEWLLVTGDTPVSDAMAEALAAGGIKTRVLAGPDLSRATSDAAADLAERLTAVPPPAGIISLAGDDPLAVVTLTRAVLAARLKTRLVLVTTAVYDPDDSGAEINPHGAPVWGVGNTVAVEVPELACTLIDLPRTPEQGDLAALVRELSAPDGENRLALRQGRRFVPRLAHDPLLLAAPTQDLFSPEETCLVTGGLGALGMTVARWLTEQGCRYLALMGRSVPDAVAAAFVDEMRASGVSVTIISGDVAKADDVARCLAQVRAGMPPLRGIVHAAGVLDDAMLAGMDRVRLEQVLAPKLTGAWNLHRATEHDDLRLFVLFSSLTAVAGSPGQANYAAANAALDGFARWRKHSGLPALSIAWGPWQEAGFAASEGKGERLAARGISGLPPRLALQALDILVRSDRAEACVADIDPARLAAFVPDTGSGLFAELFNRVSDAGDKNGRDTRRQDAVLAAPAEDQPALMLQLVRELAASVMGLHDAGAIEPDRPLQEQGFDSLMAVDMRNLVAKSFGGEFPVSLLFDYPTPEKIARFLLEELNSRSLQGTSGNDNLESGTVPEDKSADQLVDEIEQLLSM